MLTPIAIDQSGIEIHTADGIYLKQYAFPAAGTVAPQHAHKYDHTTMVVSGAIWVETEDGAPAKLCRAPSGLLIKRGVKHKFTTMADNTVLWCIHNAMHPDVAAVLAEHELEF